MTESSKLPEQIKNEISIYLTPDEKILRALDATPEKADGRGQVWVILTSHSIFFHTCQTGKEPVIALLERRTVKEIEYFQRSAEIVLTFVPEKSPANSTRLTFSISRRQELEDFCENLADLINFKKETASGIKTYEARVNKDETVGAQTPLKHAASAIRHNDRPERQSVEPKVAAKSSASSFVPRPDVKIASPEGSGKNIRVDGSNLQKTGVTPDSATAGASAPVSQGSGGFSAGYVLAATIISILVAFLWYQFFKTISAVRAR